VELVPEELAQIGDRHYSCRGEIAWHGGYSLLIRSLYL
jgi:hypothetical protein